MLATPSPYGRFWSAALIVGMLGYFVDIYDIVLFGVVRVPSLKSLGLDDVAITAVGLQLNKWQMIGMLVGGLLWGILGDRRGRKAVLFGSILLYSVANILNAHVGAYGWTGLDPVGQYKALRFLAGVGLAGELGAAITLVSELVAPARRGYATALIAGIGVSGAVAANLVARNAPAWVTALGWSMQGWQLAYWIGGLMGLTLLLLRLSVRDSVLFTTMAAQDTPRGSLRLLFARGERVRRLVACCLIGMPTWFVVGILVLFAPEFALARGATGPVLAGDAIMWCYIGLIAGDLGSGLLSQWWQSRRRTVGVFLGLTAALILVYCWLPNPSPGQVYATCAALGVAVGYWAVFVSIAAEQFGTNLRATVATLVPNIARGALWPITDAFVGMKHAGMTAIPAALVIGSVCIGLAFVGLAMLRETHGRDLDFLET